MGKRNCVAEFKTIQPKEPAKHPQYWKVKSAFMEKQNVEMQAQQMVVNASAKLREAMLAAGLDPDTPYELSDAAESITPVKK